MGCVLALPALAALLAAATADLEAGAVAEGRGTRYAPRTGEAVDRAAASTTPRLGLLVDGAPLHLELRYAPTLWSSDVAVSSSVLVNHAARAVAEVRPGAPWRLTATASALRGETDPLAGAAAAGSSQLPSTGPVPFEQLGADARLERQLDLRTTLRAAARWSSSRVLRGALRDLTPPQRGAGVDLGAAWRATERDTLDLRAGGDWNETDGAAGFTTALSGAAEAAWRRALTPRADGWLRAGVGFAYAEAPAADARRRLFPAAGAGLARSRGEAGLSAELSAAVGAFVDRFTGDVRPMAEARLAVRLPLARTLTAAAQASGGRRLDGETTVAAADARVSWGLGRGVSVEGGALWRLQRERRIELPSFTEAGVFAGVQVATTPRRPATGAP